METISVIMAAYNADQFIENSIKSIIDQTYSDWELIIVDDGSTDNTFKICEQYSSNDSRIHIIHQSNEGVSSARNTGLQAIVGKYVAFIDPDDYIEPTFLEYLYTLTQGASNVIATCAYDQITENGEVRFRSNALYKSNIAYSKDEAIKEILNANGFFCGHVWDKLFPAEIASRIQFDKNVSCFEDLLYCIEALKMADTLILGHSIQYHYLQHSSSILNSTYSKKYFTSFHALNKIKRLLKKKELQESVAVRISVEVTYQGLLCSRMKATREKYDLSEQFLISLRKYGFKQLDNYKTIIKNIYLYIYFILFRIVYRAKLGLPFVRV